MSISTIGEVVRCTCATDVTFAPFRVEAPCVAMGFFAHWRETRLHISFFELFPRSSSQASLKVNTDASTQAPRRLKTCSCLFSLVGRAPAQ